MTFVWLPTMRKNSLNDVTLDLQDAFPGQYFAFQPIRRSRCQEIQYKSLEQKLKTKKSIGGTSKTNPNKKPFDAW